MISTYSYSLSESSWKITFVICVVLGIIYLVLCVLKLQVGDPTPRPDRITRDYTKEFPDAVTESQQTMTASVTASKQHFDNVKFNEEVVFSHYRFADIYIAILM